MSAKGKQSQAELHETNRREEERERAREEGTWHGNALTSRVTFVSHSDSCYKELMAGFGFISVGL